MRWHWLLALILLCGFAGPTFGQNAEESGAPPLGDVAKKNRAGSKVKAKRVLTDDDLSARSNPIPVIALEGAENTDNILDAIHQYRRVHDAAETERVVREWFDEESEVLSAAIEVNSRLSQHTQLRMEVAQDEYAYGNQYDPEGDNRRVQQRQIAERRSQRVDARSNQASWQLITRLQQTLGKVRTDMLIIHTTKSAYDWFKIRNTNGVGAY